MFPALLSHHAKLNLKRLLETIEDYTNILSKEAEELLDFVQKAVTDYKAALLAVTSSTFDTTKIKEEGSQDDIRDVLSIFFSSEVKELGRKGRLAEGEGNFDETIVMSTEGSVDLDRVPSPIYRMFEGFPNPEIEEYMHPDAEAEFLASFKFRGPLCTFLEKSELPKDLLGTSRWLASYLSTVAKILLAKVKEIETGLTVTALREYDEEVRESEVPQLPSESVAVQKRHDTILSKYLEGIQVVKEPSVSGETLEDETLEEEEDALVGFRKHHDLDEDSPFNAPKEESPEQLEAYTDLLRQLGSQTKPIARIKVKEILTPVYITQKTSQIIKQSNLIQIENTALELFLSKNHVLVNLNEIGSIDNVQPTWGQALSILLYRLNIFKSDSMSMKDTVTIATGETSVDTRGPFMPVWSAASTAVNDTDTAESVPVQELPRYLYVPPKEIIEFDPLSSYHVFDVQPPHYRLLSVEESAKRADIKRDLSKKIGQVRKEIRQVFMKELDSDSESEEDEETGWRKWICYERRQDLVNAAIEYMLVLNTALHEEAMSALKELAARKETMALEVKEKQSNYQELYGLQRIKNTPREYRLPSQRRFSDVLFKAMKGFLTNDWKTKNLKMAELRTLSTKILELSKTVRRFDILEQKTDWGDLALQRLQYNSAQQRNVIVDDDITQLKKLDAIYTLKLIHAREELDSKIRQNKSLIKQRDIALKKKNSHKEIYKAQYKKLVEAQDNLELSPKVTEMERYFNQAKTTDYKKKKMKQYQTELELHQANKRANYLASRINGLTMEPSTRERMKARFNKVTTTKKFVNSLKKSTKDAEVAKFGIKIVHWLSPN